MGGVHWIGRDIRQAVRSLLRDRGSVSLAVLALSLGIGATTVIFSVVDSIFINAFPFADQSRVVHFYVHAANQRGGNAYYDARDFVEYRSQNAVFSEVLGGRSLEVLYARDNAAYRTRGAHLDTHALRVLGVTPILGRDMIEADGAPDAPPTFLMSDRLWNSDFDRDPKVIGMTLKMNGVFRTLIGILPSRFLLHGADVFFPTTFTSGTTEALVGGSPTDPLDVWTYARLKPGVTPEQAAANIAVIGQNLATLNPERYPPGTQLVAEVRSLADAYTATSVKEMVYILSGAVLMLLMIACSNVANLLLARATARETALALCAALGASRGRLIQQLLTESFVLASAGTMLGALLAYAGLDWVRVAIPINGLPSEMQIRFSSQALLATVGVTIVTTLVCGLAPALRAARGDLQSRLTSTGKGVGAGSRRGGLRAVLVAVQITLAIVLLVGAGLMMRTFVAIQKIDPGFDTDKVLVGQFSFPREQHRTTEDQKVFVDRVVERMRTLPDVTAVSPSSGIPLSGGSSSPVAVVGTPPQGRQVTLLDFVGEAYFQAVRLAVVTGRVVETPDVDGARKIAVVNRRFVQDFLGGGNPIGRLVTLASVDRGAKPGTPPSQFEIVGVVGDSRNSGLQQEIRPEVFLPYTVAPYAMASFVLRTSGDPRVLPEALRRLVSEVDQSVALMNVGGTRGSMLLEDVIQRNVLSAPEFGVGLLGSFAAIGLILSAIGVFSVMAYTVSLQTRDIGIRMALGAQPGRVMRTVLVKGLYPIAAGVVIGIVASYNLTRVLANHLYGVTATDPWTFAGVAMVLAAVGVVACALPARRAMRIDPLVALRQE